MRQTARPQRGRGGRQAAGTKTRARSPTGRVLDPPSPLCKRTLDSTNKVRLTARQQQQQCRQHQRMQSLTLHLFLLMQVLGLARSLTTEARGDVRSRSPQRRRAEPSAGAPDGHSPVRTVNPSASSSRPSPRTAKRDLVDAARNPESAPQSYAQGKNSLWLLAESSYSSATMRALLEKAGLGAQLGTPGMPDSPQRSQVFAATVSSPLRAHSTLGQAGIPLDALVTSMAGSDSLQQQHFGSTAGGGASPSTVRLHAHDTYLKTFSGMQAYGKTGMTVLEELVEAAFRACDVGHAQGQQHVRGAAVLTRGGRVYAGCNVESASSTELSVSAERTTLLKAVSEGESQFRALVLVSDTAAAFPSPEGGSRQFLAEFGDFAVYLVNRDLLVKACTTYELFPMAQPRLAHDTLSGAARFANGGAAAGTPRSSSSGAGVGVAREARAVRDSFALDGSERVRDWSVARVSAWLQGRAGLPEYAGSFTRAGVDGALLLRLREDDLRDLLRVGHPLHRRRLLLSIDTLRERDRHERSGSGSSENDYAAAASGSPSVPRSDSAGLELSRIRLITKLKAVFDRFDDAGRGELPASRARRALEYMACDVSGNAAAAQWVADRERSGGVITFPEFAMAYSAAYAHEDPDIRLANGHRGSSSPYHSPQQQQQQRLSPRGVELTKSGHVRVRGSSSNGAAKQQRSPPREAFALAADSGWEDSGTDAAATSRRGSTDVADSEADVTADAAAIVAGDTTEALQSVRRLAETKRVFDRFAVSDLITAAEAVQALTEAGCAAPRGAIARYLRGRRYYGLRREIPFFEFMRALAALGVDVTGISSSTAANGAGHSAFKPPTARSWRDNGESHWSESDAPLSARKRKQQQQQQQQEESARQQQRSRERRGRSSSHSPSGRSKREKRDTPSQSSQRSSSGSGSRRKKRSSSHKRSSSPHRSSSRGKRSSSHRAARSSSSSSSGSGSGSSSGADKRRKHRSSSSRSPRTSKERTGSSSRRGDNTTASDSDAATGKRFAPGDKVEVDYRSKGKWFRATVAKECKPGLYNVDYDDGDKEQSVEAARLRLVATPAARKPRRDSTDSAAATAAGASSSGDVFCEGDKIEARYKGRERYFPGVIRRVNRDGTYDINYDDGERELGVAGHLVKIAHSSSNSSAKERASSRGRDSSDAEQTLLAGDKVEARYKGRERYYSGVIKRTNRDGSYDIDYNDGERELAVPANLVRPLNTSAAAAAAARSPSRGAARADSIDDSAKLVEGDKVEARYKGRERWFAGRIRRANRDSTYDIDYDDGERELGVSAALVRLLNSKATTAASSGRDDSSDERSSKQHKLAEGDRCEGNYRAKGKWYKGTVRRVNRDGTVDINYDDGERELGVAADLVRAVGSAAAAATATQLREGDKVEARYKGRARYFPGVVRRANRDGTFDINYDDGERELGVLAEYVRALDEPAKRQSPERTAASSSKDALVLREGDKVEARYRGRERWFAGTIRRVNRDSTYDINYDDGEKELSVAAELVRLIGSTSSSSNSSAKTSSALREGDAVEANYRQKGKWFKGKISRKNLDNSYNIAYDDGDTESSVLAENVRRLGDSNSGSVAVGDAPLQLRDGDKIEARYRGRERWFAGVVKRANRDDTYDINYDDGERELGVAANLVRLIGSTSSSSSKANGSKAASPELLEGDKIEARYKGRERYFPGVVRRVNRDGTYDINYDDGERELGVLADYVKLIGSSSSSKKLTDVAELQLREGDKVEARYRGRERYFPGTVRRANRDGTYDINYDDGEKELGVLAEYVRLIGSSGSTKKLTDVAELHLREGDKVEARYRGRERWFAGSVHRVNRDGTYDINYDDGERELGVAAELVRLIGSTSSSKKAADSSVVAQLREGDKVEARYKGRARYFPGVVKRVNRDGSYDINYDDGERELGVDAELVRSLEPAVRSPSRSAARTDSFDDSAKAAAVDFRAGDKIEARYKGRERYYSGTIKRANRDGSYDVDYDDGEKELSVEARLIKLVGTSSSTSAAASSKPTELLEGDKIEARYRGRERYFPGVVRRVNRDGTFDINYDDGERELGVAATLVRAVGGSAKTAASSIDDSGRGSAAAAKPREGDKVEARYKGRARYYPGVVRRANRDGTYDIDYDDGEKELGVDAELVRLLDSGSKAATASKAAVLELREGDKIEARYRGRERWFAGTIRRINRDGSYDINYDDGERELGVAAELVRLIGSSSSSSGVKADAAVQLREGDKIEARYKGRERYFPGTVRRVNRDDTYDINYDDGERELGVAANLVRLIGSSSTKPNKAAPLQLREGDKIEARYRGRERYFPGVIKRANRDDTYDIAYDDGERELSVAADLVRLIGSTSSNKEAAATAVQLREGDKIEARYKGRERWFAGVIKRANRDDTYDILYDDGEREAGVEARLVRLVSRGSRANDSASSSRAAAVVELVAGDKVEARYRGRERYFPGTVRRANRDGTYDIDYDDGEKEISVLAEYVKLAAVAASPARRGAADSSKPAVLLEGDKIEARYKGRARYFPGVVRRANRDGTYDINYDDGERELGVDAELVRLIGGSTNTTSSKAAVELIEGDKIEARYKGRERYFPGVVRRVNRDGTYDINYDDGERELGVLAEYVKLASSSSSSKKAADVAELVLREGDKIEARYRGRERYFPGTIRRVNRDGTYDVNYDDGEKELSVLATYVRLVGSTSSSSKAVTADSKLTLRQGDKIEARYKSRARYFPGTIRRANRDGTYDIDYNDGELELGVDPELVRLIGSSAKATDSASDRAGSSKPAVVELSVGEKIQARYRGRERYFPGVVRRVNRDSTYDIDYDDGEKELSVAAEYVKLAAVAASPARRGGLGSDSRAEPAAVLLEGDKIEARYRGRERWFAGTIRRANRDGTFDINYDDGERELGVVAEYVRAAGGAAAKASSSSVNDDSSRGKAGAVICQGDKVEARYKGRARYYSGVVRRANRDGTYDIDYDDGEKEPGVDAELVRLLNSSSSGSSGKDGSDDRRSAKPAALLELQAGDKVQARYHGRERYFPGTVRCSNRDGTYDIDYDDGEKELSVLAEYVKLAAVATPTRRGGAADTDSRSKPAAAVLLEGDKIEARYRGRERYFPGVVRRANRDGTYDVDYDDGEKELGVLAEYVKLASATAGTPTRPVRRSSSSSPAPAAAAALREGDKIEARYRGRERYFPGVVRRVNRDGSYDIDYDDGEKELSVEARLVKARAGQLAVVSSPRKPDALAVATTSPREFPAKRPVRARAGSFDG
jgi:cytidine deaminase